MKFGLFLFLLVIGGFLVYAASNPSIWGPFLYPLQYKELIKTNATTYSLPPNLVAAVIYEESRFNAGQESQAGARGLMQLLPSTAASIAKALDDRDYDEDKLFEPERNIRYGTHYLRYLLDKYRGDEKIALAAYNAGEANVDRWQEEGRREIPFEETREFVRRVEYSRKMYDTIYDAWYEEE